MSIFQPALRSREDVLKKRAEIRRRIWDHYASGGDTGDDLCKELYKSWFDLDEWLIDDLVLQGVLTAY